MTCRWRPGRRAAGRSSTCLQLGDGERITGMVPVREFREDECLFMVTRRGTVKKTELTAFKPPLGRGIIALGLDENDQLIGVARVKTGDHVILSTRDGMSIRFDESRVRVMGRPAYGVKGIDLADGDEVVGMIVANGDDDPASILTVCAHGYGKRTPLDRVPRPEPRRQGALIDIQTSERNGPVVAVAKVTDEDEVMLTTSWGMVIRTKVDSIRTDRAAILRASGSSRSRRATPSAAWPSSPARRSPRSRPRRWPCSPPTARSRPSVPCRPGRATARPTGPASSTTAWPRPRPATTSMMRSSRSDDRPVNVALPKSTSWDNLTLVCSC